MSIIFADGFDDGAPAEYITLGSAPTIVTGGRNGGSALRTTFYDTKIRFLTPSAPSTIFIHLALNRVGGLGTMVTYHSGTSDQLTISCLSDGSIQIRRGSSGGTILGTSPAGLFPSSGFTSFQIKLVVHPTAGSVEFRLNGGATPAYILSGANTQGAAAATITDIELGGITAMLTDDVVIWDTAGTVNNDWLGDLRVDSYLPNADGDTVTMTPSTGTTHYTLVDEVPASATDYVTGDAAGEKDLFMMGNMGHTPTVVHAVIPAANMVKTDAGLRETTLVVKSGGVEYDGSSIALGTSAVKYTRVLERNPNGDVAWTKSSVDALQVGVKVTV